MVIAQITITIQREIAKSTIKLVSQRRRNRLLGLQAAVDKRATDRKNRPIHELTITVERFIYRLLRSMWYIHISSLLKQKMNVTI